MQGIGRAVFAATLLMIAGFVNIIYGAQLPGRRPG
jgi:hypothetical protein